MAEHRAQVATHSVRLAWAFCADCSWRKERGPKEDAHEAVRLHKEQTAQQTEATAAQS